MRRGEKERCWKRCTTGWDVHGMADTTLKRSGKRVNLNWVEIRNKATSVRARGVCERQSMK